MLQSIPMLICTSEIVYKFSVLRFMIDKAYYYLIVYIIKDVQRKIERYKWLAAWLIPSPSLSALNQECGPTIIMQSQIHTCTRHLLYNLLRLRNTFNTSVWYKFKSLVCANITLSISWCMTFKMQFWND